MLCCRRGELHSDLWLRPNHWQPGFEERWGAYSYSPAKPHAVAQAGANSYVYDQNGNMTSRTVDGVVWTYAYNAENQLISTHKDNQLISEYGYDGDGKRVAEINADGTATIFIGNYFEGAYPEPEPP
ncbi:MAG: hypothetical protein GX599_05300, partial [Chloroflexi bacterium]|nr:hypothetical protein [Chloroflexota bacterium]